LTAQGVGLEKLLPATGTTGWSCKTLTDVSLCKWIRN